MNIKEITEWLKKNGYAYNIWKGPDRLLTDGDVCPNAKLEICSSGNVGIGV